MVTWTQIIQAVVAVLAAGTVVYLINRASRKQVENNARQRES